MRVREGGREEERTGGREKWWPGVPPSVQLPVPPFTMGHEREGRVAEGKACIGGKGGEEGMKDSVCVCVAAVVN